MGAIGSSVCQSDRCLYGTQHLSRWIFRTIRDCVGGAISYHRTLIWLGYLLQLGGRDFRRICSVYCYVVNSIDWRLAPVFYTLVGSMIGLIGCLLPLPSKRPELNVALDEEQGCLDIRGTPHA